MPISRAQSMTSLSFSTLSAAMRELLELIEGSTALLPEAMPTDSQDDSYHEVHLNVYDAATLSPCLVVPRDEADGVIATL